MENIIQTDWISTEEAAPLFDYDTSKPGSRAAFLQFAMREGVPYYRLSARRFRWSRSELEEWLRKRRIGGSKR